MKRGGKRRKNRERRKSGKREIKMERGEWDRGRKRERGKRRCYKNKSK